MAKFFWSVPMAFLGRLVGLGGPTAASAKTIDDDAKHDREVVRTAVMALLWFLALGVLLATFGGSLPHGRRAVTGLGLLIVVGITALCSGAIVGFVFGIPRALQGADAPKANGEPSQNINTNLEQISDWLTKIIVGVSLVQAQQIFATLVKTSERLGKGLVGFDPNLATGIVALAIVAGFVIGFLAMYIETRTFLSPMFLRTAKIEQRLSKTDLSTVEDAPRPSSGPQQPALSPDQRAAIGRVAAQPISTAKTPEELATWAKAMFWEEDYADAAQGYTQALVSQPNDYKMRRENGRALVLAGKIDLGIAEIDKAREQAAKAQDLAAMQELDIDRVWAHLYRPVDGFEKAIEFGQKIMTDNPTLAGDPQLQTYMACAYGQKYARYSIQEKADLANQAAEEAKVAIKKVIDAPSGASWRKFLQTLASGRSTDDDDLAILAKERDDVRKMIDDATS